MKISRIIIKNYRNLKSIDVNLNDTVALIGENNSGKSNFLRAATLPFLTDEIGFSGKNLSWIDINNDAKKEYYKFLWEGYDNWVNNHYNASEVLVIDMNVMDVVNNEDDKKKLISMVEEKLKEVRG